MTDSIESFLNSAVGKKAVEVAYGATHEPFFNETEKAIRAFLSSLAEQGALREAPAFEYGSTWVADTSRPLRPIPMDFPAFILRRE